MNSLQRLAHRVGGLLALMTAALTWLVLTGCSSSGTSTGSPGATSPPAAPSGTSSSTASSGVAGGTVPDPCTLLTAQQVASITGESAGTPSSSRSGSIYPTERTCSWDPVVTFVGLATDFTDLRQTVTHDFGPVQPIQGVGQDAFWDPEGNELVARGDRFFVAAELSGMGSTDSEAKQIAVCKQLLTAMLANG